MRKLLFIYIIIIISMVVPGLVSAESDPDDRKGSKEHPLFTRMPGYFIDRYTANEFDQYKFKDKNRKPVQVEGRFYKIVYTIKKGKSCSSTLQIIRNHTNAVQRIGGVALNTDDFNGYYIIKKSDMETWAHIHAWGKGNYYEVIVVEKQGMVQDVVADSAQMARDIKETGKVALYGIYFDSDKSDIKPESDAALKEITKFLKNNPSIKIYVVGHTDSDGSLDHNKKLSEVRAKSVVKELNRKYGIAANRLAGYGVGPLCPVQSNKSANGKAKNRRVELVEQ